ncbi:MAG: hypothetical protein LBH87_01790 [Coriobacteriales bacterium]|jgi:exopolyphosphatase/guanosine-5'-triphosphate,3'-diphosphate pyrophosphatase|nr:hypothetical protein [Coriobacteriales bacterium]
MTLKPPAQPLQLSLGGQRIAAFDFGTVTTRLLIAEVGSIGIHELLRETQITHMGQDLDSTGVISLEAIQRVLKTCRKYLACAAAHAEEQQVKLVAVGTSAFRDAQNSDELLQALSQLGIQPRIVTGAEEARLSFLGALSGFEIDDLEDKKGTVLLCPAQSGGSYGRLSSGHKRTVPFLSSNILVVDIGGGSTELIAGEMDTGHKDANAASNWASDLAQSSIRQSHSFNIGARRLTERYLHSDPPKASELDDARQFTRTLLAPWFKELEEQAWGIDHIIAVAGTATTVVSIRDNMVTYDPQKVHGSSVSLSELKAANEQLCSLPLSKRQQVVGLEPARASVVIGGLLILEIVLELAGIDHYIASESDILRGIIFDAWESAN